jgi:LysM repeat protein
MGQSKAVNPISSLEDSRLADDYIRVFSEIAISEMNRTGIPASIIMAQGMLESRFGQSDLAKSAKNHFGIKCHNDWHGSKYYHNTKEYKNKEGFKNEVHCFRVYDNPEQSYIDHSDFLVNRENYRFLFSSKNTDYKYWANGLSKAKYATDPSYANKLIELIEQHQLQKYDKRTIFKKIDKIESPVHVIQNSAANEPAKETLEFEHLNSKINFLEQTLAQTLDIQKQLFDAQLEIKKEISNIKTLQNNSLILSQKVDNLDKFLSGQNQIIDQLKNEIGTIKYSQEQLIQFTKEIVKVEFYKKQAKNSDGIFYNNGIKATTFNSNHSISDLAHAYGVSPSDLRNYNDLDSFQELNLIEGTYMYLESKNNTLANEVNPHIVNGEETMFMISQKYGIKLSKLYQMNLMKKGEEPLKGEFIFLNRNANKKPIVRK